MLATLGPQKQSDELATIFRPRAPRILFVGIRNNVCSPSSPTGNPDWNPRKLNMFSFDDVFPYVSKMMSHIFPSRETCPVLKEKG